MLSDEERKAIEVLQYVKNKTPFIFWYEDKPYNRKETINTILNLIEKQSKEIEELREKNKNLNWYFKNQKDNFVHKDKIKAKIEEIDFMIKEINQGHLQKYTVGELLGAKRFLESLLEKE